MGMQGQIKAYQKITKKKKGDLNYLVLQVIKIYTKPNQPSY